MLCKFYATVNQIKNDFLNLKISAVHLLQHRHLFLKFQYKEEGVIVKYKMLVIEIKKELQKEMQRNHYSVSSASYVTFLKKCNLQTDTTDIFSEFM